MSGAAASSSKPSPAITSSPGSWKLSSTWASSSAARVGDLRGRGREVQVAHHDHPAAPGHVEPDQIGYEEPAAPGRCGRAIRVRRGAQRPAALLAVGVAVMLTPPGA